jgi:hypothetical protein
MANPGDVTVICSRDDDNDSVSSFGSYESLQPRSRRALRPEPVAPRMPLVDGKAPEVLYVLKTYSRNGRLLEQRLSSKPFKRLPDDIGHHRNNSDEVPSDDSETPADNRPVLEVVHSINGRRDSRRAPRHSHRDSRPTDRPITSNFDGVGYIAHPPYPEDELDVEPRHAANALSTPTVEIHSEHLTNALRAVIKYYPGLHAIEAPFRVESPYKVLYHHRQELTEYRDKQPDTHSSEYAATTAKHIHVLLRFLDESAQGADVRREEERHCLLNPVATFQNFWQLLKPATIVYAKTNGIWEAFVVSRVAHMPENYSVTCWYLESNGANVNRFMANFNVPRWLGNQAICSLPIIPEAYWRDDLEAQEGVPLRESLVKLGKLYWELLKRPTYMEHEGVLVNSNDFGAPATRVTGFMSGRVICDASGFNKYYHCSPTRARSPPPPQIVGSPSIPIKDPLPLHTSRCGCEACDASLVDDHELGGGPFPHCEDIDPLSETPSDDMVYLLCKKSIPGFLLGHRQWGHLRLSSLRTVQADTDALKYLVVDDEIKTTVKALIGKYATASDGLVSPWGTDFVKNKGEGRIFLLHGTPGVGKTCTAECIAELTSRPLLSLTSGDLGTNDYNVEDNLNYFLELGQRYGAIVLLDEADVYLERRRGSDIWRNGIVSIFLRALEYYRGALFLTTNRVRSFDPAFLSRIHVALHYKTLRDEDRERIWLNSFDRVERESAGKVHVSTAARELVWSGDEVRRLQWNGREIRNAMQTALALAEFDSINEASDTVLIGEKHIKNVIRLSKEFKDSVHDPYTPPMPTNLPVPPHMPPYIRHDDVYD